MLSVLSVEAGSVPRTVAEPLTTLTAHHRIMLLQPRGLLASAVFRGCIYKRSVLVCAWAEESCDSDWDGKLRASKCATAE